MQSLIKRHHITIAGKTDSPATIVFAHGFGTDQRCWDRVYPAFADKYRLVLFDNIGSGKSDISAYSPDRYADLYGYARDVASICDSLQAAQCVFVGHSVIGMGGLLAAIENPGLFTKMVLISASPRYMNDEGYYGGFEKSDVEGIYSQMQDNYFAWASGFASLAMRNPEKPGFAQVYLDSLLLLRPDIALSVARTIFEADHRADLAKVDTETLIVQTKNDFAVPESVGEYLHAHLRNSRYSLIEAHGHFPQIAAPETIVREIAAFI